MDLILERILNELKTQKKKQLDLTNFLGLSQNAIGNWKAGLNSSYKKYLHAIADYLDVSVEYLKGETDIKNNKPSADSDDALMFALYGGDADDITPEMLNDVRKFAQFIRDKKKEDDS